MSQMEKEGFGNFPFAPLISFGEIRAGVLAGKFKNADTKGSIFQSVDDAEITVPYRD